MARRFKYWLLSGVLLWFPELLQAASQTRPVSGSPPATQFPVTGLSPETTYIIATLGFGGIAGWCVGFTLKKFAKLAALVVGVVFIAIQALAYNHFITVDWQQIKLTLPEATVQSAWMSLMSLLTYNFPFAGAFVSGLYLGFRKG